MKTISKILLPIVVLPGLFVSSPAMAGSSPKMFSLSNYRGEVGLDVTIKGKNFGSDRGEVKFSDAEDVQIKKWSKKRVQFVVPQIETQKSYRVRVCKQGGKCSKYQKFYVTRTGPEIHVIRNLTSPSEKYKGDPGDRLKITGLNFGSKNLRILFGDETVTPTIRKKKFVVFVVPDVKRDSTYSVRVTDLANVSNAQDFFVKP